MTPVIRKGPRIETTNGSDRPLSIMYRNVNDLKLDPGNPRLHSPKQIRQIARSIEAFGFNMPVLINADGQLIAGHGRVLAAQLLGMTRVPTIMLEHLSETQIRGFMIADNRLTDNSEWDEQLLAEQLKALSVLDLDFSIEVTGFEMGEIDVFIEGLAPAMDDSQDPADSIPETPASVRVSQPGDLWLLDKHRLLCGDALDSESYTKLMDGKRAAVVFADPPYNVPIDGHATGLGKIRHSDFLMACGEMNEAEFTDFLACAFRLLALNSKDGAIHFVCMDWRHMAELLTAGRRAYQELKNLCVWAKDNAGMGSLYRSQHELIFVFKNGQSAHRNNVQLGQFGRYRTNVWHYPGVNSFSRKAD